MNILKRAKYVVAGEDGRGEDGASNLEILVWMVVVMGIAIVLWKFRDTVVSKIEEIITDMSGWSVTGGTN